jgi:hypothetical protein
MLRDGSNILTPEQANAVFDILVEHAGARETMRPYFVSSQTSEFCSEFRFGGLLGGGGKFWRNTGFRADGTWGEVWYVNGYPEDEQRYPDVRPAIAATNPHLTALLARFTSEQDRRP